MGVEQSLEIDVPELSVEEGRLTRKSYLDFLRAFEQHFEPGDAVTDRPDRGDVEFLSGVFARYPHLISQILPLVKEIYESIQYPYRLSYNRWPRPENLLDIALLRKAAGDCSRDCTVRARGDVREENGIGAELPRELIVDGVNLALKRDISPTSENTVFWNNGHLLPNGVNLADVQASVSEASDDVIRRLQIVVGCGRQWAFFGVDGDNLLVTSRSFRLPWAAGRVFDKEMEEAFRDRYPSHLCLGNVVDLAEKWGLRILTEKDLHSKIPPKDYEGGAWYLSKEGGRAIYFGEREFHITNMLSSHTRYCFSTSLLFKYKGAFVCEVPMV